MNPTLPFLLCLPTLLVAELSPGLELTLGPSHTQGTLTWTIPLPSAVSTIERCTDLQNGPWLPVRHFTEPTTGELSAHIPLSGESREFFRIAFHEDSVATARMGLVPAGAFQMGDNYSEPSSLNDTPVHSVYLSSFLMDRLEVSNEAMKDVLQWAYDQGSVTATVTTVTNSEGVAHELLDLDGDDHGYPMTHIRFEDGVFSVVDGYEDRPCTGMSWYGAQAYCNYLSDIEERTRCIDFDDWSCDFSANGYRLPTEAEWEKAARGGLTGHYFAWESLGGEARDHIGISKANYTNYQYFADPRYERTTPVGYFNGEQHHAGGNMANGYGLYDMTGNVWERCWDRYQDGWYGDSAASLPDTPGPAGPSARRVIRGGSWGYNSPVYMHCSYRYGSFSPSFTSTVIGFRSVRRPE